MKRKGRKRLSVDIPDSLHYLLSECADTSNITITKIVKRALVEYLRKYYP